MADDTKSTLYSTLIERAITDFDNIYDTLVTKKVYSEENKSDGTKPTSEYYKDISANLFRIGNRTALSLSGALVGGVVKDNASSGTGVLSVDYSNSKITLALSDAGYYDANASITSSFNVINATLSGNEPTGSTGYSVVKGTTTYDVAPTDGSILGKVSVDIGSCNMTLSDADYSNITSSALLNIDTNKTASAGSGTFSLIDGTSSTNGAFIIPLIATPSYQGTILSASKADSNFKAGYFTAITKPADKVTTITKTDGTPIEKSLQIDAAAVSIETTSTSEITSDSGVVLSDDSGYSLNITNKSEVSKKTVTAGYIGSGGVNADGDSIVTITNTDVPTTKYIKAGSLGTAEGNAKEVTINGTLNTTTKNTETGTYDTTFNINEVLTKKITDGYIKATDSTFSANLTGSKSVQIKAGSVDVTSGTMSFSNTGDTTIITETAPSSGSYISLTTNASSKLTSTAVEGYIKSGDVSIPTTITGNKTFYVAKGSVTPTIAWKDSVTEKHDGTITTENHKIFKDSLDDIDTDTDYYTVTITGGADIKAGYISSVEAVNPIVKYIPKAKLKYVEAVGDNDPEFIEVTSAGYLASGISLSLQGISGSIDKASVAITLNNSTALSTTGTENDYKISLSANVDAGYISDQTVSENKAITLSDVYVKRASASIQNTISTISLSDTPEYVAASSKYKFSGDGTGVTKLTLGGGKGFVTPADIAATNGTLGTADSTGNTVSYSVDAALELDKAVLSVGSGSGAKVNIEKVNDVKKNTDGKYQLTVKVSSNEKITAVTTTPGYVASNFSQDLDVVSDETAIDITSGTSLTSVDGSDNSTHKLSGSVISGTNKYRVSLDTYKIPVTGTLTAGYYDDDLLTVSGNATVTAKSLDIDAAVASVTGTNLKPSITSNTSGLLVSSVSTETSSNYVTVSASANGSISAKVDTAGYLKSADQVTCGSITGSDTVYIKKAASTYTIGNTDAVVFNDIDNDDISDAQQSEAYNDAKNTVNTDAITITLAEHAMGSGVEANIRKLQRRLLGFAASVS